MVDLLGCLFFLFQINNWTSLPYMRAFYALTLLTFGAENSVVGLSWVLQGIQQHAWPLTTRCQWHSPSLCPVNMTTKMSPGIAKCPGLRVGGRQRGVQTNARAVQDAEHMYTHGGFKSMYGKTNTML